MCETIRSYPIDALIMMTRMLQLQDIQPEHVKEFAIAYWAGYMQASKDINESMHLMTIRLMDRKPEIVIPAKPAEEIAHDMSVAQKSAYWRSMAPERYSYDEKTGRMIDREKRRRTKPP